MKAVLFLIAVAFLFGCQPISTTPKPPVEPPVKAPEKAPQWLEDLLDLHNDARSADLVINKSLQTAAQKHAEWMAANSKCDHEQPNQDTRTFWDRAKQAGYQGRGGGENIAAGQSDTGEVFNDWMHSPGHRRNIVNQQYRDAGFGMARDARGRHYWCAVFGIPSTIKSAEADENFETAPPGITKQ